MEIKRSDSFPNRFLRTIHTTHLDSHSICEWRFTMSTLSVLTFLVVVGMMLLPASSASAEGAVTYTETFYRITDFAAIDAYVQSEMQSAHVPGVALGIVQGDQILHLKGFGIADPSGRPVTPQTPFIIGSTTKSMTAVAIMQLVEADKIELDAPVQQYLPWFRVADPEASTHITVRHLLNHTSGLPTTTQTEFITSSDTSETALEQRVRALADAELSAPVGTTWQYCNANYVILGLIIESVSGQSYESYLQEHLFTPLEMHQTFTSQVEAQQHEMATGYRYWFGFPVPADLPFDRGNLPAGFVISSAEDMAHYLIVHLNGGRYGEAAILSPAGIAELHRPAVPVEGTDIFYGMGWYIAPTNGVPTVRHVGETANFHANLVLVPEGEWGIVLLMNGDSAFLGRSRIEEMVTGVTSLLVGRTPPAATPLYEELFFYFLTLGILFLQIIGIIRSVKLLRRWRTQPERRPRGLLRAVWHVVPPLVLNLIPAFLFLVFVPQLFGLSLPGTIYRAPDLGYVMAVSSGIALAWSLVRTGLALFTLSQSRNIAPLLQERV
jgi:CubicO group peptidase (beta-lactamase class C family)